jgi:uncharacterized membrane protein YhaH (DUF805 family)
MDAYLDFTGGEMINYYTGVLKNYAGFEGRARRAEYWQFALVNIIITIVLDVIGLAVKFPLLGLVYGLAILVPSLAVAFRRLHDTGRSAWWILIALVPFVGAIVLLVFTCLDSTPGPNQFGPNPKGVGNPAEQYSAGY